MQALESIGAILCSVVHQKMTIVQIFVMREDEALIGVLANVFFYPIQLVTPSRRIFPRRCGKDIGVK